MLKKNLGIVLVVVVALSLCACAGESNKAAKSVKKENVITSNIFSNISNLKCVTEYPDDTSGPEMDIVIFGKVNDKPIKWLILKKDGEKALLFSLNSITKQKFAGDNADDSNNYGSSWNGSYLKNWLNNDFYNTSFNQDEKALIIKDSNNSLYANDKIFIPDKKMLNDYFNIFAREWLYFGNSLPENNSAYIDLKISSSYDFSPIVSKLTSESGQESSSYFMDGETVCYFSSDNIGVNDGGFKFFPNYVRPAMWVNIE